MTSPFLSQSSQDSQPPQPPSQRPSKPRFVRALRPMGLCLVAAAALVACGGGGSSGSGTPGATGTLSVRLTDGPDSTASHVWITLTKVAVNASDVAEMADSGWVTATLPAPVTVDMNTLANGELSDVITSLTLPVGSYKQMRLVLAGADEALTDSASSAGLIYNDQVDYVDGTGAAQSAPLQIAQAKQGIALHGTFDVTADTTLNLAVEFDVGKDVVPFKSALTDAFALVPELKYFDLNQAGAVTGVVDMSACAALAVNPCRNLVAKAEAPSNDGTYQSVKRWTTVNPDGSFMLYPLPASQGQTYDIVVRGDNAESMVVRQVPVTVGATPSEGATAVSADPLPVQSATGFAVNWAAGVQPTGGMSRFYQTVGGTGSAPHEFSSQRLNPFTGTFLTDLSLSGGSVLVGDYVAGADPVMNAVTPAEGSGTYMAMATGHNLARTSASTVAAAPGGGTTLIAPPVMTPGNGVAAFGTIVGMIKQNTLGRYDSGDLVVTQGGMIANAVDIHSVLVANGGAGGTYSIGNLPAGSTTMPLGRNGNGKGIYYAYLRVWNSAAPDVVTDVPVNGSADMDSTASATLNVTLP
jgi:hypothetical protein